MNRHFFVTFQEIVELILSHVDKIRLIQLVFAQKKRPNLSEIIGYLYTYISIKKILSVLLYYNDSTWVTKNTHF